MPFTCVTDRVFYGFPHFLGREKIVVAHRFDIAVANTKRFAEEVKEPRKEDKAKKARKKERRKEGLRRKKSCKSKSHQ